MEELMPRDQVDDGSELWICQGFPRCELQGDAALQAQNDNCVWCTVKVMRDGVWIPKAAPVEA
jgi:hypothetical protein